MIYRFILTVFILVFPQHLAAGPWLRDKGSSFTAVSIAGNYALETANQTYLEYGLTDTTTLIGDVGMARFHYIPNTGYATFSIRRALGPKEAASKWAYELGLGAGWVGEEILPHVRTALSWGRGITLGKKPGWMTVEGTVLWDVTYALHVAKVDTTVGLNATKKTKAMVQIFSAHAVGETIATLAPSVVYSPANTKFSILLGAESQIGQWDNTAVKIGIWREF